MEQVAPYKPKNKLSLPDCGKLCVKIRSLSIDQSAKQPNKNKSIIDSNTFFRAHPMDVMMSFFTISSHASAPPAALKFLIERKKYN